MGGTMRVTTLVLALALALAAGEGHNETRYGFYRDMAAQAGGGGRRLFGGYRAAAGEWGAACALLDRYWATRCSGAVLAPRWALTAAHCVSPRLAYVKYNTRRPAGHDGNTQPVLFLYRHPEYRVVQEDLGQGLDVTLLHHDIGLVWTRGDMVLADRPAVAPLAAMALYDAVDIRDRDVEVLGFGRTESSNWGEELFSARMALVACSRGAWLHCVCGTGGAAGAAGVCAGDSGGPVLYRGAQVGVTSMGPVECARGGTSVFTALRWYAALVNGTIQSREEAARRSRGSSAAALLGSLLAPLALTAARLTSSFTFVLL